MSFRGGISSANAHASRGHEEGSKCLLAAVGDGGVTPVFLVSAHTDMSEDSQGAVISFCVQRKSWYCSYGRNDLVYGSNVVRPETKEASDEQIRNLESP
jgi:hypothetical protein